MAETDYSAAISAMRGVLIAQGLITEEEHDCSGAGGACQRHTDLAVLYRLRAEVERLISPRYVVRAAREE